MSDQEPAFGVPPDFRADPERVSHLHRRLVDAGTQFCYAAFVDIHGIPKSKVSPIHSFEEMCNGHELYTVGANEGMGLAGPHEDECAAVPDLDSLIIFPWDASHAWFSADLWYRGRPYPNSSRQILQRVLDQARQMGFGFNLGIEPEFYIFNRGQDGSLEPITHSRFKGPNACYDVSLAVESKSFLAPISAYLEQLGWGLYSFDQECGRGQHEFDFGYADALSMADRFIFLRFMIKHVAQSIGAVASFMPKPFSDDFRSGAHFNMSLRELGSGRNLFAPDAGPLSKKYGAPHSDLAHRFAAGILKHAGAITALTCPTYNSYQGLIARGELADFSWAPILRVWGKNNRSAMLRFPLNRYCVENRAVDMSCNPYLAAALTLAAGLEGIVEELDPGEPINTDVYKMGRQALSEAGISTLPPTMLHALEAFEDDPLVEQAMGQEFKTIFLQHKRKEWERSFFHVSAEQRDSMLTFI